MSDLVSTVTSDAVPAVAQAPATSPQPSGVDLAQIARMLDLSPIERVQVAEDWVNGILELRRLANQGANRGEIR